MNPTATRSGWSTARSSALIFLLVFAASAGAAYLWKKNAERTQEQVLYQRPVLPAPAVATAPEPAPEPAPATAEPAQANTPTTAQQTAAPDGNPVLPSLRLWVVHAGEDIPVKENDIILPAGARFAIKVHSAVAGQLAFYTINPKGISAANALWKADIKAGDTYAGPTLRLEGQKGLETLRVVLQPVGTGDAIEQHVQIWHQ